MNKGNLPGQVGQGLPLGRGVGQFSHLLRKEGTFVFVTLGEGSILLFVTLGERSILLFVTLGEGSILLFVTLGGREHTTVCHPGGMELI